MAQEQIVGKTGALGAGGSLAVYQVPGSALVSPVSVSSSFDGTGAAGAFIPCLTFKTQTGAIIARCPAPEVAAGATAEVSWFPSVGGSSSTATTDHEGLNGSAVNVANGAAKTFTWAYVLGSALLDLTVPTAPTIVTAGVYAISVCAHPSADLTAGGAWELELSPDTDIGLPPTALGTAAASTARPRPYITVGMTWYLPAGTAIYAYAHNYDGAATRTFGIFDAMVQRLS